MTRYPAPRINATADTTLIAAEILKGLNIITAGLTSED